MFTRKIGKLLRGNATPFQIISATVLGGLLGSLPGLSQGPLLFLTLLFLLIVLNANLFLAGITLILVKLISLILLPLYFQIGVSLLEGPLGNLVAGLVNAPFTAWFGLEYYVMLPSLIVGGLLGFFLGLWLSRAIKRFRSKMAQLETGSEKYQAYTAKPWVKFPAWVLLGGLKGKKSWSELNEAKRGLPVRPLGIILMVSLVILIVVGLKFMDTTIITTVVRNNLEKANGATVDVEGVEIQPGQNRVILSGLAMADPENLQTNRFAANEVIADVSGMNLLAKKVVVDFLEVVEPRVGTARKIPGRRTVEVEKPVREEEKPREEGEVNIEDYLGQASAWKERLATIKRVYERIAPYMEKEEGETEAAEEEGLSWRDRLAQQAREKGYARVKSDSLIRKSPRLLIRDLKAENLEIGGNDDIFNISGNNLSTQPALLTESGQLKVVRGDGDLSVTLGLPTAATPSESRLQVGLSGMEISELEAQAGKELPMKGGTMDISGDGTIDNGVLDVPLKVTLKNTTVNAFGTELPLNNFPLEIKLYGPMEDPNLKIPTDALKNAATEAGKSKVENLIKEKGGDELKKLLPFGN